ncbi:hypothetical protein AC579_4517 [Pseudocercospora musae]|uniref:Uncharacterized protein n=1 Tax=Pseudocercospora musae TaxID=113226 RepID=A0A139GVD7_9PEZI|nr:hypothetical protein AC579_4517 [Pseudocercospora musae]
MLTVLQVCKTDTRFDNTSILRGNPRRRADSSSSESASQHNAPKRSYPFSLSFTSGSAKALANISSNQRLENYHASAGPEHGAIPDDQARSRSYRTVITSKDAEEVGLHVAKESVNEPALLEQYPILTVGQHQPGLSTQSQSTFGAQPALVPPSAQTQARPGKMKQAQRGLAETARQIFKPAHPEKDSKDLMRESEPRLNGYVEHTTSVYGPLQHDGTDHQTHGHSSDAQNRFFGQLRQAGAVLAGKRKNQHEKSEGRSRKRARDQSDWHDLEVSDESPPISVPPGCIGRTISISVDTHLGLETEEYSVPPPHVYQMQQQQPPAPVPVMPAMPEHRPYMTGQYFQTAYQSLHDPHTMMHAFGEQAGYLAQPQSHQLPCIAEDELAEREEERLDCLREIDDECPSLKILTQQRGHSKPAQTTLQDEGVGSGDDANRQYELEDVRQPSSSRHQSQNSGYDHSSIHKVSSMEEEFNSTRSPVSSLSDDTEMMRASDDELSQKDRLSLAACQRAVAELDEEKERLRKQFEQLSWCHGQEEEFGAYTMAADRGFDILN